MLTFTKIAANCDGSKIWAYLTQENPEPVPHDLAGTRPLLMLEDGPGGAVYPFELPVAGVPDYHLHNFIPNVVATRGVRTISTDCRVVTEHAIAEFEATFQVYLGENLRRLGVRAGYDETTHAVVALDIPEKAVALFS